MHEALRRPAGLTLVPLHIGRRATLRPSNHNLVGHNADADSVYFAHVWTLFGVAVGWVSRR